MDSNLQFKCRCAAIGSLCVTASLVSYADTAQVFNTMDRNQDGQVTDGEFWTFWNNKFNERDKDGDGRLSQSEVGERHQRNADVNQDGYVSLA